MTSEALLRAIRSAGADLALRAGGAAFDLRLNGVTMSALGPELLRALKTMPSKALVQVLQAEQAAAAQAEQQAREVAAQQARRQAQPARQAPQASPAALVHRPPPQGRPLEGWSSRRPQSRTNQVARGDGREPGKFANPGGGVGDASSNREISSHGPVSRSSGETYRQGAAVAVPLPVLAACPNCKHYRPAAIEDRTCNWALLGECPHGPGAGEDPEAVTAQLLEVLQVRWASGLRGESLRELQAMAAGLSIKALTPKERRQISQETGQEAVL